MKNIILIAIVFLLLDCHIVLAKDKKHGDCKRYGEDMVSGVVSDIEFIATTTGMRTIIHFMDERIAIFAGIPSKIFQIGENNIICRNPEGYIISVKIE